MVLFNELRITPDGKHLVIEAQVQELDYYTNVYIDSIVFDVDSTYSATGPSTKAVTVYSDSGSDDKKKVRIFYDIDTIQDKLFFVYVITKGTPADDTPCGMKETTVMGITFNKYTVYSSVMKGINNIGGCTPASDFISFILRLKAFELALKTGNYTKAIEFWNSFFTDNITVVTSNCGCYG